MNYKVLGPFSNLTFFVNQHKKESQGKDWIQLSEGKARMGDGLSER
jgi:hypothetical protein